MDLMSLLKMAAPLLVVLVSTIQLYRDWKHSDRDKPRHHQLTKGLLGLLVVLGAVNTITAMRDNHESAGLKKAVDQVRSGQGDISSQNAELLNETEAYRLQVSGMQTKIDELVDGKNQLLAENAGLKAEIAAYQKDLQIKEGQIKQLDTKGKMAARGISSSYDFNGAKREGLGDGRSSLIVGEETEVFQRMVNLGKDKKYAELIALCTAQTKKTPEWLTPYLFRGLAYADLGEKNKAIVDLKRVADAAPGDPHYSKAAEVLKQIQQ